MQVIDKELAAERALKTDWRKINKSYRAINRTENVQKRRIVRKHGETNQKETMPIMTQMECESCDSGVVRTKSNCKKCFDGCSSCSRKCSKCNGRGFTLTRLDDIFL